MLSRRLLRIKVIKALYSHFKSESDTLIVSEKNLNFSIDKTYQLYHLLLSLIVDVRQYASKKIDIGKNKMLPTEEDLNPNMKFVENRAVAKIADNDELLTYLTGNKLGWTNYPELVKKIYNNMISSGYYTDYMNSGKDSFAEDLQFVIDFYSNGLEDMEELEEAIEEQSIYWADDIAFGLIMVVRTLQGINENKTTFRLLPKFKNDDDRVFASQLFRAALVNNKEYFGYINEFTENWDLERFAYMDRIVMLATIAELVACTTIPVKVTLDEFIEISKYYSTPSSGTFINGVLDKIVEKLKKEGRIEKQGRGLIEN
ncbi:MAG: transcription antitermination protein NusB [Rikenellaceae bacterium]|nr:transcription antitermination protein NusB [Rikenellaceae bacterium]